VLGALPHQTRPTEPVELMEHVEQTLNSMFVTNLASTMVSSVLDMELAKMTPVSVTLKLDLELDTLDQLVTLPFNHHH